ncbi:uncharacterized protein TNIN_280881 [Trichonephila inaurata madagascariensis]|uniref:Uncharacterized protein n=1 Tax=Trichonephila inaurata madagascariensis TaxID=2747483 RepID=A0A8X6IJW9_9ARAC|nr:uncharacterized protein TNIN_280881 [Trichonephila inaurata madagascariensis]
MASDPIFCHFVQELFPYSYEEASGSPQAFKEEFTPKGPLTKDLIELIASSFNVIEIVIQEIWSNYIGKNRRSMIQSAEFYVWHTISMCWMEEQIVTDIYDRFLSTIVLVRYVTEMIYCPTGKKFYKLTSRILTVFFENSLREDFMKRGGWKRLGKHILNRKYHEYFNECAQYGFIIDFIPEDLKKKIRQSFSFITEISEDIPNEWIDDLTHQVMWSAGTSVLNEINSPKINKGKSVSKEAEGTSSKESNVLKDSDMPRSSEKQINLCVSHLNQLEEKLKELISMFELLEAE